MVLLDLSLFSESFKNSGNIGLLENLKKITKQMYIQYYKYFNKTNVFSILQSFVNFST